MPRTTVLNWQKSGVVTSHLSIFRFIFAAVFLAGSVHGAPAPFTPAENTERAGLFSGYAFAACSAVDNARAGRGLGGVLESTALATAASFLIDHMLREDWVGLDFPSGYTLQTALSQAGYPAGANVQAVIRVSSSRPGFFGDGEKNVTTILSASDGYDPNMKAFGYYAVFPKKDAGRVNTSIDHDGYISGGYYEVMLFGNVPPDTAARLVVGMSGVTAKYNFPDSAPISAVAIKGKLFNYRLTTSPASKYLAGKPRIKGRLPRGVRFLESQAKFYGTPKKKGTYKLTVTANYRKRHGVGGAGTDGGLKSTALAIRVR